MKKSIFLTAFLGVAITGTETTRAKDVLISTPRTTLLLQANEGEQLRVAYYGSRIEADDVAAVYAAEANSKEAYPAFGTGCQDETALSVQHADGNLTLDLAVQSVETSEEASATLTTVTLKDRLYPFTVDVCYRAHKEADVIETWTVIKNNEKKSIHLLQYASGFLPIRVGDVWISHLHGNWGAEAELTAEPLRPGVKVIKNTDGARNTMTDHPEVMFSLDGRPMENSGRVIGAALCWSGNYKLRIDTNNKRLHHFFAGINEEHSDYELKSGESFTTPELALTYSEEGLGGASRTFHRWARAGKVHNGKKLRNILLNSWEGVYFGLNQQNMEEMMHDFAALGGELFVMDDGWFGSKYRRVNDQSSLGDWTTDTVKLPQGVPALVKAAQKNGMKFGIWIEPEMTNTKSELYEKHPDWVVCPPQRQPIQGRGGTQLVLDVSNPKVQDFIFKVVDDLMQENPDLHYIKWDCNMSIMNYGSHYLTADRQSHLYVDFHLGLRRVLERIRAKYPDLVMQACASGGGRVNYGLMPYFEEFWVSDNTDALQRLFIQWGTSYFYPSCAMAQHVSASPNHQTGRRIPLKFRFDVAMTGRLGMEMQPKTMNDNEKEFAHQAIATYKEIRPVIQQGDQYRLLSPYGDTGFCSELYSTPDKAEAVFFAYKIRSNFVNEFTPRFRMAGLDPARRYKVTELNRTGNAAGFEGHTFSGKFLMETGLELYMGGEFASKVLRLQAE